VVSAIFLVPVWVGTCRGRRLSPFLGDRYNKRSTLWYGAILLSVLSVCNVGVLWPRLDGSWISMALGVEVGHATLC